MLVEAGGGFIGGVYDDRADGKLLGRDRNPPKGVAQARCAETAVLVATVDCEPREDRHRDWVVARHALACRLGRLTVVEFARE